jgi:hypothetical protein
MLIGFKQVDEGGTRVGSWHVRKTGPPVKRDVLLSRPAGREIP